MKRFFNPLLPGNEYLPDPEPRIFNNRIYIYGSHDKFNGISFCLNDYVTYSCDINNLSDWRYEGVIYKKEQDKMFKGGIMNVFFASDCILGLDGYYYLYYTLGFKGYIGVARSKTPNGPFEYYGNVKYKDGTLLGKKKEPLQFDPAIFIDDDNRIYLYSGFAPKYLSIFQGRGKKATKEGAMVFELDKDMLTIVSDVKYIAKTLHNSKNTSFEGHEFFEASSLRKFNRIYYFIYSSINGHELCYATSKYPDKDFEYQGVLISNCDRYISKFDTSYPGNNHGSILNLDGKYYVFYHRQTNRNSFSRQTMVEKLEYENGLFKQAEMTSMGLLNTPLKVEGEYNISVACNIFSKKGSYFSRVFKNLNGNLPYFTQLEKDNNKKESNVCKNFSDESYLGFKYFNFDKDVVIGIKIKGKMNGNLLISLDNIDNIVLKKEIKRKKAFEYVYFDELSVRGIHALYITFKGKGHFLIESIKFN